MERLQNKKDIQGMISYDILNESQSLLDITLDMEKDEFDRIIEERERKSYLVIIIDKSGSMYGKEIEMVKRHCKTFVEKYFERRNAQHPPIIIFFNTELTVV
jgi:uncharacterized protein with von Willebrand factor type A (vWA) domain